MKLTVTGTNDGPSTTASLTAGTEDTDYTFTLEDFPFLDSDGSDVLSAVRFTNLSDDGELLLDTNSDGIADTPITINESITRSDLQSGSVVFRPQSNFNGITSLSFSNK